MEGQLYQHGQTWHLRIHNLYSGVGDSADLRLLAYQIHCLETTQRSRKANNRQTHLRLSESSYDILITLSISILCCKTLYFSSHPNIEKNYNSKMNFFNNEIDDIFYDKNHSPINKSFFEQKEKEF